MIDDKFPKILEIIFQFLFIITLYASKGSDFINNNFSCYY